MTENRGDHLGARRNCEGSAILVTLLMLVVLAMVGAQVLRNVGARYNSAAKSAGWQEALAAAESAANVALVNLRWTATGTQTPFDPTRGWSGPDAQGTYVYTMPAMPQAGGGTNLLWATATVESPPALRAGGVGEQWHRIRATGYAALPGLARSGMGNRIDAATKGDSLLRKLSLRVDRITGNAVATPQATRRIEVIAQPRTPFQAAIIANVACQAPGAAGVTDSFDSRDPAKSTGGRYDPAKFQQNGDVIVNTPNMTVGGTIWGDVGTNGGSITPSPQINGQINNGVQVELPPVRKPGWSVISPTPTTVTSDETIVAGPGNNALNFKLNEISRQLNVTLPAGSTTGSVNVWVTGDITGGITVQPGVTCKVWFEGNIAVKARDIDNLNYNAAFLQFYGIPPISGTQAIALTPPGDIYAAIYAPNSDGTLNDTSMIGNVDLMGAIVAGGVSGNGCTSVHYDEALAGVGLVLDYLPASWVEDVR